MKYIKEYNSFYSPMISIPDKRTLIDISDKTISTLKNLGFDIEIDNISRKNYAHIEIDNIYIFVFEYEDEWFEVEIGPINHFAPPYATIPFSKMDGEYSNPGYFSPISYWCDQIDGLTNCLKENVPQPIKENLYTKVISSWGPIKNRRKDIDISDKTISAIKSLGFNVVKDRIIPTTPTFVVISLDNIKKFNLFDTNTFVFEYKDEWFEVQINDNDNDKPVSFMCDQLEGLVKCLEVEILHKDSKINESESEYYHLTNDIFMDKVFNRTPTDIDDKIVNKINNEIGVNGVVSQYEIVIDNTRKNIKYYKLFIHLTHQSKSASMSIYAYNDEWYRAYINLSGLLGGGKYYWCDQVHGVIKLIKDTICDEYYETNESNKSNKYYSQITAREFDSLLVPRKALKFDDKDLTLLQNIDSTGDYSFELIKPNYVKNADHQYQWISFFASTKIKRDYAELTGEIYRISDEWYLVEISDDISRQPSYYKCDQVEGLLEFLKNLKKKSPKSTLTINDI